jgi:hypothetical protein
MSVSTDYTNVILEVNQVEQDYLQNLKRKNLQPAERAAYDLKICAFVQALRLNLDVARGDPKRAHTLRSMADTALKELDQIDKQFWKDRAAVQIVRSDLKGQWAKVGEMLTHITPEGAREKDPVSRRTQATMTAAGAGAFLGLATCPTDPRLVLAEQHVKLFSDAHKTWELMSQEYEKQTTAFPKGNTTLQALEKAGKNLKSAETVRTELKDTLEKVTHQKDSLLEKRGERIFKRALFCGGLLGGIAYGVTTALEPKAAH